MYVRKFMNLFSSLYYCYLNVSTVFLYKYTESKSQITGRIEDFFFQSE